MAVLDKISAIFKGSPTEAPEQQDPALSQEISTSGVTFRDTSGQQMPTNVSAEDLLRMIDQKSGVSSDDRTANQQQETRVDQQIVTEDLADNRIATQATDDSVALAKGEKAIGGFAAPGGIPEEEGRISSRVGGKDGQGGRKREGEEEDSPQDAFSQNPQNASLLANNPDNPLTTGTGQSVVVEQVDPDAAFRDVAVPERLRIELPVLDIAVLTIRAPAEADRRNKIAEIGLPESRLSDLRPLTSEERTLMKTYELHSMN